MKILLIKSYYPYPYSKGEYTYNRIWPPLCLANCASILEKNGHKVEILDAHAQRITPNKIANFISGYDKIFITSSSLDKWQCPNIDISYFLESVRYIRQLTDEVYIMGYHGTVEPEKILELSEAKAVIRGEPEYTVLEICQNKKLSEIKGISFLDNKKIISNPPREPLDLKTLPIPAFHLLDFDKYFYEILGNRFCLFEINRGCYFNCKFCNKVMYGEGVRSKSEEQVLKEITFAIEKYRIKTGYFIDLDFLSYREIVEQLCDYLIKKKYQFKWTCQTRPDRLNIEILEKMKAAGCKIIHLGIETTIQKLLDYINKSISIEEIEHALMLCKKFNIKSFVFFLFGIPNETNIDRKKILDFIKKLRPDFVSFHKIIPYKGVNIYYNGFKSDENLDKFICKIFFKYYLRPSYLWKLDLPLILRSLKLLYGRIKSL